MAKKLEHVYPHMDVHIIRNGVDDTFSSECPSIKQAEYSAAGPRIAVVAADFRDRKKTNVELVSRVTANLGATLVTIGRNSPFSGPRVTNHGQLWDRVALFEALRNTDAMLFTSTIDNLPMVVVEALCAGTPVIAVESPGADEILCLVGGRTVALRDLETMRWGAFSPLDLYTAANREDLAATARRVFSRSAMTDAYFALYQSVIQAEVNR
jgi:putative colanic acid biosynthesis glycosyltransferase